MLARVLLLLSALLVLPASTPGQETAATPAPATPTNETCLECHRDSTLEMRRKGEKVPLFVEARHLADSVHESLSCVDCHEGFAPDEVPHKSPLTPASCTSCHDQLGKSHAFHPRLGNKEIPAGKDTACSHCHGTHAIKPAKGSKSIFAGVAQAEACGRCHTEARLQLEASAHAPRPAPLTSTTGKAQASRAATPLCLDCHRTDTVAHRGATDEAKAKLAQVALCESCHVNKAAVADKTVLGRKFVSAFDSSVHGAALHAGKADAAACADCHGSHETNPAAASNSKVSIRQVTQTCAKCHAKAATQFQESIHGTALARGNLDAPTCTRCHGEHEIRSRADPASATNAKNLSQQVCADCHSSIRLAKRYGLDSDRFSTFSDSYHGLAVRGGAAEVVNCSSCHGSHEVLPQDNPASNIHKDRLAQTCGHCHPGASTGFTIGKVHASGSRPEEEPLLYWVSTIYVLMIIVIVGGMALHNLIDFVRKARRKLHHQQGLVIEHIIEHRLHLRMTLNERLQHATLVISFILLVITGFMLRYPEAWWVEAIRGISTSAFEWRGLIHRIAGVAMLAGGVWHLCYLAFTERGRTLFRALLPRLSDLTDPLKLVRYNLGLSNVRPRFDRFSYIEKAEYWALVWGTVLMALTGAILWFDNTSMGLITKLGFDVARAIHFFEAILATLAILVWHMYWVILNPDVYPMNLAWLTGRMSEKEMLEDHPIELLRIKTEEAQAMATPPLTPLPPGILRDPPPLNSYGTDVQESAEPEGKPPTQPNKNDEPGQSA